MSGLRDAVEVAGTLIGVGLIGYGYGQLVFANDFPELHYRGNLGNEQVKFVESPWPWSWSRSALKVTRSDGSTIAFVLRENSENRGFTLEQVVSSGNSPAAPNAPDAQAQLKGYFNAILNEKSKDYR